MRGQQERSGSLFSGVSIEEWIPASHPLREKPMPCRQAKDAEIGLLADLIGVDSAFSARNQLMTVETGQWAGFSANS